jgi:hypothetical protein
MRIKITNPLFTQGSYANLFTGDIVEVVALRDPKIFSFPIVIKGGTLAESEVEYV